MMRRCAKGTAVILVCSHCLPSLKQHSPLRSRFVVVSSQGVIGRADGANGDPNHKRGLSEDRVPFATGVTPLFPSTFTRQFVLRNASAAGSMHAVSRLP